MKRLEILGFGCERAVSAIAESAKHKVKGAKTIFRSRRNIKERFISTMIQIGVCNLEIRVLKLGIRSLLSAEIKQSWKIWRKRKRRAYTFNSFKRFPVA